MTRKRLRESRANRGVSSPTGSTSVLDPDVVTFGFARRVPSYKRLTLDAARAGAAAERC